MRYLRYVRKLRNMKARELRRRERRENREARRKMKAQRNAEKREEQEKRKLSGTPTPTVPEPEIIPDDDHQLERQKKIVDLEKAQHDRIVTNKAERKKRTRRLLRFFLKVKVRRIKRWIKGINRKTLTDNIQKFKNAREVRREFLIIAANSTAMFLISFMVILLISRLASGLAASFFDYDTIMRYDRNYYLIRSDEWHADSVKLIFSSAPVLSLFTGFLCLIIFSKLRQDSTKIKTVFFWAFFHGFTMFFGGLLVGTLFNQGFGHAINWMYVMDTGKLIYAIISIFALLLMGFLSVRSWLLSANAYYNTLNASNRRRFVMAQVLWPFITGNLLLFVFWLPGRSDHHQMVLLTMLIALIPVLLRYPAMPELYFEEKKMHVKLSRKLIFTAVLLMIAVRIVLGIGIPL